MIRKLISILQRKIDEIEVLSVFGLKLRDTNLIMGSKALIMSLISSNVQTNPGNVGNRFFVMSIFKKYVKNCSQKSRLNENFIYQI